MSDISKENDSKEAAMIGSRIRMLREEREMSQKRLAEIVGISPSHLWLIENGRRNMSVILLGKIVSALKVSADDVLFGKSDMENQNTACFMSLSAQYQPEKMEVALKVAQLFLEL